MNSDEVKRLARDCGADVVGIASMDRFEGAPKQMDPRYIFPGAKAMIVMGFRILRGALRGVEEGTFFATYSSMGYAAINHVQQPMVLWNLCRVLEDAGWEAVPLPNQFPWSNTVTTVQPDKSKLGDPRPEWSRAVSPDKPAPDVFFSLRIAAFAAGLGEIGWSKMFLTPQFGPRQRLAAVMTDMPLESDPLYSGPPLCDRCMLCARDCTVGAISKTDSVKITVAGRTVEWSDIDHKKCSMGFCGGSREFNPFMVSDEDEKGFNANFSGTYGQAQRYKVPPQSEYGRALEGARGCIRACMVHLDDQGKLGNTFHNPFRTKPPWRLG
jgi:epoxyqueuosine reductase QueG